jgi:VanZ family protein
LRAPTSKSVDTFLWALSWLMLLVVVLLSLVPLPAFPATPGVDKLVHGFAYAALTLSFLFAGVWRPGRGEGSYPMAAIVIVVGTTLVGVIVELIQDVQSYRSMDAFDALADAVGAALGAILWATLRRARELRPSDA